MSKDPVITVTEASLRAELLRLIEERDAAEQRAEMAPDPYDIRQLERKLDKALTALREIEKELGPLYAGPNSFGASLQSAKNTARAAITEIEGEK